VSGAVAAVHDQVDAALHRAEDQLRRLGRQQRQQPGVHHLRVAGLAEHPGEPAQLVAQRVGHLAVQQRAEGAQGAAQTTRRHAHLVHRVVQVTAHLRVPPHQLAHVLAQVGLHGLGGGRPAPDLDRRGDDPPRRAGAGLPAPGEHPPDLRPGCRRHGASGHQALLDVAQQRAVAPGQLGLPLAPAQRRNAALRQDDPPRPRRRRPRPARRRRVEQAVLGAAGGEPRDGDQRLLAGDGATSPRSSAGTGSVGSLPGRCSSSRSSPSGTLRCQPASLPPARWRRVIPLRRSRRSAVSK
jgi:hypothetical protein